MTIEAMRQALGELERLQPILANGLLEQRQLDFIDPHVDRAITTLRAAIEQAENQEPVAWLAPDGSVRRTPAAKSFREWAWGRNDFKPLYTAPPPRQWQDLTKREFLESVDGLEDLEDCWVAIQAKLKEKNT